MQVRLNWFVVYLIATALSLTMSNLATAQSVSVQVPGGRSSSFGVQNSAWPPNSMSAELRRWESILDKTYPSWLNGQLTGSELVRQLNRLGLPVVLTESARDDMLPRNEVFGSLPLPGSSLRARLTAGLKEYNATICFGENHIGIVSLDDAGDYEYFMTVSYDVTQLVEEDPYHLVDSITETVDPDGWQDTGQGLGTIVYNSVNGRDLITISQTYMGHRGVQQVFGGMNRLTGASRSARRTRSVSVSTGSRSVSLPRKPNTNNFKSGGMFRVPD